MTERIYAMKESQSRSEAERGQVLVIVALSLVVVVAMVGVVIDGGFLWGKQRNTQNAADASAEAGAVVLAHNLVGVTPAKTDADVAAAVNQAAAENGVTIEGAWYTNINGSLLNPAGAAVGSTSSAAAVGDGTIPPNTSGVRADAEQMVDTFIARVVGFQQFEVQAGATAIAGYATDTCPSDAGCVVLPVTFPTTVVSCDGTNKPVQSEDPWDAPSHYLSVPLCQNGPGNVGWLDWTPTAGGTSELVAVLESGESPGMSWPGWYYMTSTGNINSKQVEDAINNNYSGKVVQIPLFDLTCNVQPDAGPDLPNYGCPDGHVGGTGSNQWYHVGAMTSFELCSSSTAGCTAEGFVKAAYIAGSNPICDTGNGGTSCLTGRFLITLLEGNVSANPPSSSGLQSVGVQLIR